ncbi:MAG: hypothetical protein WC459_01030 [Patescibacteria group bacterium]
MRHIVFFFFYSFVLWFVAAHCTGCSSPYYVGGMVPTAMARYYGAPATYYRPAFSPPPGIATMYRTPRNWSDDNPLSIRVVNDTEKYARCYLGAREMISVSEAGPANMPLLTQSGIRAARVIPPGATIYDQLNEPGNFFLKCQLFTVGRDGVLRFVLWLDHSAETNAEGGRSFYLHNANRGARSLPVS